MEYGTAEQKERFIPAMASGDEIWAQGWSEPNAGSDMAAIRCRADRDGDEFVINGQKIWSTRAVYADWVFGLFRTDPDSTRHHGLSKILVPLNSEGVTVRPIPQLNGLPGFAEIFFDDVRVPAFNLLGGENEGWRIAMATAGFERGLMLRSPARFQQASKRLVQLYREHGSDVIDHRSNQLSCVAYGCRGLCALDLPDSVKLCSGGSIGAKQAATKSFGLKWICLSTRQP